MSKSLKNPTRLQGALAIASFVVGTIIGSVSLFLIPPPDSISNSALGLTSEFLIMASGLLGVNVVFDYKMSRFESKVKDTLKDNNMIIDTEDTEIHEDE